MIKFAQTCVCLTRVSVFLKLNHHHVDSCHLSNYLSRKPIQLKYLLCALLSLTSLCGFAQETIEIKKRVDGDFMEVYHVSKTNDTLKQGLYQLRYHKKTAIASGLYTKGQRAGIWHFFDLYGNQTENFDYNTNEVTFESSDDRKSGFIYQVDKSITDTDRATKPIKPGGRIYGYLPLLRAFKMPKDLIESDYSAFIVQLQLLISPFGRLADYNIVLQDGSFKRVLNVNLNLFNDDEKTFIPATFNKEGISCTILVECYIANNGKLTFLRRYERE